MQSVCELRFGGIYHLHLQVGISGVQNPKCNRWPTYGLHGALFQKNGDIYTAAFISSKPSHLHFVSRSVQHHRSCVTSFLRVRLPETGKCHEKNIIYVNIITCFSSHFCIGHCMHVEWPFSLCVNESTVRCHSFHFLNGILGLCFSSDALRNMLQPIRCAVPGQRLTTINCVLGTLLFQFASYIYCRFNPISAT